MFVCWNSVYFSMFIVVNECNYVTWSGLKTVRMDQWLFHLIPLPPVGQSRPSGCTLSYSSLHTSYALDLWRGERDRKGVFPAVLPYIAALRSMMDLWWMPVKDENEPAGRAFWTHRHPFDKVKGQHWSREQRRLWEHVAEFQRIDLLGVTDSPLHVKHLSRFRTNQAVFKKLFLFII